MADEKQVTLLRQGVAEWNAWCEGENQGRIDLAEADLSEANLSGANLSGANRSVANLSRANLGKANLGGADLFGADLTEANLSGADLFGADLSIAYLGGRSSAGRNSSGRTSPGPSSPARIYKEHGSTRPYLATLTFRPLPDWRPAATWVRASSIFERCNGPVPCLSRFCAAWVFQII
jgi:uncharacterized protein YjbI with pentapeptide repeats